MLLCFRAGQEALYAEGKRLVAHVARGRRHERQFRRSHPHGKARYHDAGPFRGLLPPTGTTSTSGAGPTPNSSLFFLAG